MKMIFFVRFSRKKKLWRIKKKQKQKQTKKQFTLRWTDPGTERNKPRNFFIEIVKITMFSDCLPLHDGSRLYLLRLYSVA